MSIDRYFVKKNNTWTKVYPTSHPTSFWVDLNHGGPNLIDERYYFDSLDEAQTFYEGGWHGRELLDDNNQPCGLDIIELYADGKCVQRDGLLAG